MQRDAPVAYVPQLDGLVLTRRDDIDQWEKRTDYIQLGTAWRADDPPDG